MIIGERLRQLREEKKFSQGDIEKRTGLLRCYVSRVENGHTVPSIETLEKLANALETPMYRLFYDGDKPPVGLHVPKSKNPENPFGDKGPDAKLFGQFYKLLAKMSEQNRAVLIHMASKMQKR
jgi:transcriptional regulator with XRE-family HTH domain